MSARLLEYQKLILGNGAIVEIEVWALPRPTEERTHGLKYSLFYGRPGQRIVGYDNETGKGDHRHLRGDERAYRFTTFERLLADFWRDVHEEMEK
jgi:hypothetical protein